MDFMDIANNCTLERLNGWAYEYWNYTRLLGLSCDKMDITDCIRQPNSIKIHMKNITCNVFDICY